jgi:hypothetical protein
MNRYRTGYGESLMGISDPRASDDGVFGVTEFAAGSDTFNVSGRRVGGTPSTMPDDSGNAAASGSDAGSSGSGSSGSGSSGTGTSGGTSFSAATVLTAIQNAPINDTCKQRANAIVNGMLNGTMPNTADSLWFSTLVAAMQGTTGYPSECAIGPPWYIWALGGAGCLLLAWLIYYGITKRKRNRNGNRGKRA